MDTTIPKSMKVNTFLIIKTRGCFVILLSSKPHTFSLVVQMFSEYQSFPRTIFLTRISFSCYLYHTHNRSPTYNSRLHNVWFNVLLLFFQKWQNVITCWIHRRWKWGRTRSPNILANCRFGAAVFKYVSCLFYYQDSEIRRSRSRVIKIPMVW